jgi:hypothetical protein
MKKQEQKFKEGDVIKNARNNFQRIIRRVAYMEKDGMLEARYFYSDEKLDNSLRPTGYFNDEIAGDCSQINMLHWQRGQ